MTAPGYWGERRPIGEAAGNWIAALCVWEVFATLTFKFDVAEREGHRLFKRFCQKIAREVAQGHIFAAWGWEKQIGGRLHFHVLLGPRSALPTAIDALEVGCRWPYGNCLSEKVRGRGAAAYLARHESWSVAEVCPRPPRCRRQSGCLEAKAPWPDPGEGSW